MPAPMPDPSPIVPDPTPSPSPLPVPPGPDGYRQILTWVTGVLSVQYEVIDIIETDDRIVFRAIARGVGVPQLHGPAAAGRAYEMSTIHIYRTEGDRLAEHWGVRDEVGAMVQMGVLPAPDPMMLDAASR